MASRSRARAAAGPRSEPDVQRVVEHAGVAVERGPGGRAAQGRVAGDLGVLGGGEAQRPAAGRPVGGQRDQLVDQGVRATA